MKGCLVPFFRSFFQQCGWIRTKQAKRSPMRSQQPQLINGKIGFSDECIICCQPFEPDFRDRGRNVLLPCKHAFHQDCIDQWFAIRYNCPTCSTEFY